MHRGGGACGEEGGGACTEEAGLSGEVGPWRAGWGPAAGLVCCTKGLGSHQGQWENLKDFFIFDHQVCILETGRRAEHTDLGRGVRDGGPPSLEQRSRQDPVRASLKLVLPSNRKVLKTLRGVQMRGL